MGIIGLGCRGTGLLTEVILKSADVTVSALCDIYEDRTANAAKAVESRTGRKPFQTCDFRELLSRSDVDAVLISASWEDHIKIAIEAIKEGKAIALEVGGAYSVGDCFELVGTWEETGVPFMFMENCCYDRCELLATAMARAGKFGRIVHCEGSYSHDLREEIAYGEKNRHYRLRNYLSRNLENYPTHELGPIAKLLNINRGNRMMGLVCASTGSFGMNEYISCRDDLPSLQNAVFSQGDIFHTLITCENGETVLLRLDTTLPRFYTRNFTVRGTKGFYEMNTNTVFIEGEQKEEFFKPVLSYKKLIDNASEYEDAFLPDMWKRITPEERNAGHGGMDWFEFSAFFDALRNGKEMPIDVYDAASWMVISALTEESAKHNGSYIEIPDFTSGRYRDRKPKDVTDL